MSFSRFHAIFPSRHHRAAKVRVFTDFCLQLIRTQNGEKARGLV